jgi:hypothetical protein
VVAKVTLLGERDVHSAAVDHHLDAMHLEDTHAQPGAAARRAAGPAREAILMQDFRRRRLERTPERSASRKVVWLQRGKGDQLAGAPTMQPLTTPENPEL